MTIANVSDVSTRLGRPITSADEIAQVNAWLADVESAILERVPDLDQRIDDGTLSAATVVRIEAGAVVRRILNPGGLTSVTRSVDDVQVTERRESPGLSSDWLTDADWAALQPASAHGAFTIRPAFTRPPRPGPWL